MLKGSQTSEHPWMHVPDLRQDALFREKSCILWALSLAAQTVQVSGVSELSVSTDDEGMRVCVTRPFPAATLILLPMVLGSLAIATESVHPHRVAARVGSQVLYLLPSWKTTFPSPFWAVRRTSQQSESNSALAEMRDDVVHSFAVSGAVPGPEFRHVSSETIIIHVLVNTLALEAGQEVVFASP